RPVLLLSFALSSLPPTSLLFPYTTLFRSLPGELVSSQFYAGQPSNVRFFLPQRQLFNDAGHRALAAGADLGDAQSRQSRIAVAGDRKSTRLNSSHVSISYAVFCLKKKRTH